MRRKRERYGTPREKTNAVETDKRRNGKARARREGYITRETDARQASWCVLPIHRGSYDPASDKLRRRYSLPERNSAAVRALNIRSRKLHSAFDEIWVYDVAYGVLNRDGERL